jgi:hypothetical protein
MGARGVQGAVEDVREDGWVLGWAFDPSDPAPLSVRVELAGRVVAEAAADIARADIQRAFARDLAGFRLHAAALAGLPAARIIADVRVIAATGSGPREVTRWSRLLARLEERAEAEARAALLARLQGPEARATLRGELAEGGIAAAAPRLAPLLDMAESAAATPEGRLCRAALALAEARFADCLAQVTEPMLDALDAEGPALAAAAAELRVKAAYAQGEIARAAGFLDAAAARGWAVEATLAAAIRRRVAEAAEPGPALQLPPGLTLVLTGDFAEARPRWGAVGLGLEDAPPGFDRIIAALDQVPQDRRHLVASIAGMGFLRLIGRLRFARITFFDPNVAEIAKLVQVRATILATPHDAFDGFRALDSAIRRGFGGFYLPGALGGIRIAREEFRAVADGRATPAETLLSPLDHPGRAWQPTAEEYARARENLAEAFDHALHLAPPPIAHGMFGIAWLGALDIGDAALRAAVGSAHVAPLRATGDNAAALDAGMHRAWRARDLAGNHRMVWVQGGQPGATPDGIGQAMAWATFRDAPDVAAGACVMLDGLLGAADGPAEGAALLAQALDLAAGRAGRVIVAEDAAREAAARQIAGRALRPAFELAETAYTPGPRAAREQVLLALQKAGEQAAEPED